MKIRDSLFVVPIVLLLLVACGEKYDGEWFGYNKCEASLNGVTLIDQQPARPLLLPNALPSTPNINFQPEYNFGEDLYSKGYGSFQTELSDKRAGDTKYSVKIQIPCETYEEYISTDTAFEQCEVGDNNAGLTESSYIDYCGKHSLPVAIVNDEIASDCKFKFTTFDANKNLWNGEFTINFSEGVLSGKFVVYGKALHPDPDPDR